MPVLSISPLIETDTVYFPPGEFETKPNGRFSTPLMFYNPNGHFIDRFDLWIRYSPEMLEPVEVSLKIEAL